VPHTVSLITMFKNTLLIDDDPNTLYLHRHFLDHYNFYENLLEFQDANLALDVLAADISGHENLVLLDLNMPIMSGLEFVDKLHSILNADQLAKTTIVLVSSSNNPHDIAKANDHPYIFTFIEKPFLTDDIELLIKQLDIVMKHKQKELVMTNRP